MHGVRALHVRMPEGRGGGGIPVPDQRRVQTLRHEASDNLQGVHEAAVGAPQHEMVHRSTGVRFRFQEDLRRRRSHAGCGRHRGRQVRGDKEGDPQVRRAHRPDSEAPRGGQQDHRRIRGVREEPIQPLQGRLPLDRGQRRSRILLRRHGCPHGDVEDRIRLGHAGARRMLLQMDTRRIRTRPRVIHGLLPRDTGGHGTRLLDDHRASTIQIRTHDPSAHAHEGFERLR